MKCPFCGDTESKVTDSRSALESSAVRRRRECLKCLKRFTTFETVDLTLQVKKRDGRYEEFSFEKIIRGLDAACRHTSISHDQVVAIASDITAKLVETASRELDSLEIGKMAMNCLKQRDIIAYIRFACVYKRFKDRDELIHAIEGP